MKKILFLFGTVLIMTSSLNAQVEPTGKFTLDLTFDPAAFFDASAGSMFNMPLIKARFFLNPELALRLSFDDDFSINKSFTDADGNDYITSTSNRLSIAAGIEKHFGAGRFSPYIGGDLAIQNYTTRRKTVLNDVTTKELNPNGGHFMVGVYAALGADFYILPSLYVGVEFAPGFGFYKEKDEKTDGTVTVKGGYLTSFSLSSASGLRVGFRF